MNGTSKELVSGLHYESNLGTIRKNEFCRRTLCIHLLLILTRAWIWKKQGVWIHIVFLHMGYVHIGHSCWFPSHAFFGVIEKIFFAGFFPQRVMDACVDLSGKHYSSGRYEHPHGEECFFVPSASRKTHTKLRYSLQTIFDESNFPTDFALRLE